MAQCSRNHMSTRGSSLLSQPGTHKPAHLNPSSLGQKNTEQKPEAEASLWEPLPRGLHLQQDLVNIRSQAQLVQEPLKDFQGKLIRPDGLTLRVRSVQ